MAQVRNPWHLRALAAAVTQLGGTIASHTAVVGWDRAGDRILVARAAQDSFAAGEYLLCGGAWSDGMLEQFGVRLGVKPVRGQIVLYRLDDGGPGHIHIWNHRYLVPRGDGLILAGSTEEDVGFDSQTSAECIADLRSFAESHWPELASATVEKTWAGLRPGSPDGRPFLGRIPNVRNLSVATGHFRAGIQLSPATGRAIAELLTGRDPFIPLDPFHVGRPIGPPIQPAFRS